MKSYLLKLFTVQTIVISNSKHKSKKKHRKVHRTGKDLGKTSESHKGKLMIGIHTTDRTVRSYHEELEFAAEVGDRRFLKNGRWEAVERKKKGKHFRVCTEACN